jgi:hypothetical protein
MTTPVEGWKQDDESRFLQRHVAAEYGPAGPDESELR